MGTLVGRAPHDCGSRQGLNLYEEQDGRVTGFCFSCKRFEPNPLGGNTMEQAGIERTTRSPDEIKKELDEIATYPFHELKDRKIGLATMQYFGTRVTLDQERREDVAIHYYPYESLETGLVEGYKYRVVEGKHIRSIGQMKNVYPFGWAKAIASGSPRLFITEGEIDAMSLFSVIMQNNAKNDKYKGNIPAVVSIPHGASGAGKDLAKVASEIRKYFKEVVLVFDNDDAGQRAIEDTLKVLPEAKVANIPGKDVNDAVLGGHVKAVFNAVMFNATSPKNTRLVSADELFEAAKEQAVFGLSYPWKETTDKTRGIRFGETVYIGAAQKMGKSEVVNAIGAHLIQEHGLKVLMAKPEEANKKTVKLMAGKIAGAIFHDPKIPFDEDKYDKACEVLRGKLLMLNLYQHLGWETLKGDIRAAVATGVKAVFIDPITNLVNGMDSAAANTKLQEIAQELAAMALDLDIVIFIFCHLRNPDAGIPHERGGKVLSSQFAGSRAMARSCNYMFGLEGNKDPDLPEEDRNCRQLVLLEDREFGEVGPTNLYWNKINGMFVEL